MNKIKFYLYNLLLKTLFNLCDKKYFGRIFQDNYITLAQKTSTFSNSLNDPKAFFIRSIDSYVKNDLRDTKIHDFTLVYNLPQYSEITNAIYIPNYMAFYSENGELIPDSATSLQSRQSTPKSINVSSVQQDIKETFLYIGAIESLHYGHFLIEGLSHLWCIKDWHLHSNIPLLYASMVWTPKTMINVRLQKKYIDQFLQIIGLNRKKIYYFDKPTKVKSIIIPQPSLLFGQKIYQIHKLIHEYAAFCVLQQSGTVISSSQPLYLSRTKLNCKQRYRNILDEEKFENFLIEKGFKIAYPERMTLHEQIILMNQHQFIVGCEGTALHNILFSLNSQLECFCLANEKTWLGTSYMIDSVKSIKSNYIFALQSMSQSRDTPMTDKRINIEHAIYELEKFGF